MNFARKVSPIARPNILRNFYRDFRYSSVNYESSEATQPVPQEEKYDFEDIKNIERSERRKPAIEPFMKNVFVSRFDTTMFAYPEILKKDEYDELEQRADRLQHTFSDTSKSTEDRINALKQNRMYAAPVSLTKNGLAMNVTERLRYLEEVSSDFQIAQNLSDHWIGLEALKLGLKPEDYERLLSEFSSGEKTIGLGIKEPLAVRLGQTDFSTTAVLDGGGAWRINGIKECFNTDSDYFLVLCMISGQRMRAYLVEKSSNGVETRENRLRLRDATGIPLDCIKEEQLSTILGLSRLDNAVISCQTLNKAILACVKHVRAKFVAGKSLSELSTVCQRLGETLSVKYACESAAYLTAGILDGYETPDAELEMAMCRNFISYHGSRILLSLEGIPELSYDEEFQDLAQNVRELARRECDDNINFYIALTGLHHAGKMLAEEVKQMRNPLMNPGFIFKKVMADRHQERDEPKLNLHLSEYLHPTLASSASELEYCVVRMRFAVETVMGRYGAKVDSAYTDLERLSQAATEIYVLTAVLARASRSYCIGLHNCEIDMKMAACFTAKTRPRVRQLIKDLVNGEYLNLDKAKIEFGTKMSDTSTTLVKRPIDRTFW